jgi:hypothetical protein
MKSIDERTDILIHEINTLYETVSKEKWVELNKTGFIFELERNTKKLKELFKEFSDINRELGMLLEKNTPDISDFIEFLGKQITVFEANLKMEKTTKWRENMINEHEPTKIPDLYSSIQEKLLAIILKSRYSAEKISAFLNVKKTHFSKKGSTAKNLLEILEKKETELEELKARHSELRRRSFLGFVEEKNIAEIEREVNEIDKQLATQVAEMKNALKIHLAQIEYLEGSFAQMREKAQTMEEIQYNFSKKSLDLIKEMKKERDYAKKIALDIEQETMKVRSEYTNQIIGMENTKHEMKEKIKEHYEKEIKELKEENEKLKKSLKEKKNKSE